MKTREEVINSMCYTYRHDYGLTKEPGLMFTAGVTEKERAYIHTMMSQIFDNDIAPFMEFKK
jgi:hypothetical protein